MSAIALLARLEAWRDTAPDALAAMEDTTLWSVSTLLAQARDVAGLLRAHGTVAGDRIAWHGPSSLDFARVLLGTWMLDATYVGINPRYTTREVDEVIDRTTPRLVLSSALLREWRARVHCADPVPLAPPDGAHPALLVFTTGSTGRPKVVVLSHRAVGASAAAQAAHTTWWHTRTINALPANHIGSIANVTTATWWAMEAVDFVPVFSPEAVARQVRRTPHARLAAVPAMLRRCLDDPAFMAAAPGHLRHVLSGGAPLPRGIHDALQALGATVQGMYGQSEVCGSVCFTRRDDDAGTTCNTVGRPHHAASIRIARPDGASVGDHGELQVRCDHLLDGYLDDPDATAAAFTPDGWLRTGDLAVQRADGAVTITGRLKDVINTGGYKVMPAEVEQVLHAHPAIASAVVVGAPDPQFGEVVAAVIVTHGGAAPPLPALEQHCRALLANYKVPRRWVHRDTLPTLGVGKVDRQALRMLLETLPHA